MVCFPAEGDDGYLYSLPITKNVVYCRCLMTICCVFVLKDFFLDNKNKISYNCLVKSIEYLFDGEKEACLSLQVEQILVKK